MPGLEAIERAVFAVIAKQFDLPTGFDVAPYDDTALAVELREFFPSHPRAPARARPLATVPA